MTCTLESQRERPVNLFHQPSQGSLTIKECDRGQQEAREDIRKLYVLISDVISRHQSGRWEEVGWKAKVMRPQVGDHLRGCFSNAEEEKIRV